MNRITSVACATALTMACLDGHAKVADKCIVALEARDAHVAAPDRPRPCPTAIAFQPRSRDTRVRIDTRAGRRVDPMATGVDSATPSPAVPSSERALHA